VSLQRKISAKHLWAIAVGMVISGQYFGWNFAFAAGGLYGLIFAAILVTLFYLCFMFSYAELATSIPHAGGPSEYARKAFGPFVGYLSGLACLMEFIFAPPAIAVSIGSYLHFLCPIINPHVGTISAFVACILINLTGTKNVAVFETVVTIIALIGLVIYYSFGLPHVQLSLLQPHSHLLPHGIHSVFAAIPFAIWLYLCIEGGAMAAEEVKDTHKDITRGFISAIVTLAICSFFTILVTSGLNPHINNPTDYPLPHALTLAYTKQHWLPYLVDIFGLFGLIASLNGIIIGYSRQTYALARSGYLPKFLCKLSKQHVPAWALIIPGGIGLICAASANFSNSLIILAVFGATISYCLSMLSLFKLRYSQRDLHRPFKVIFPWIPGIAFVLGLLCVASIYYYAIRQHSLLLFSVQVSLSTTVLAIGAIMLLYYLYRNKTTGVAYQ
jgi:ethanolamine permease